jgi:hypothetical protein
VMHELKDWGWEHAHRLSKFVYIDEYSSKIEQWIFRVFFYPALKISREVLRGLKKYLSNKKAVLNKALFYMRINFLILRFFKRAFITDIKPQK